MVFKVFKVEQVWDLLFSLILLVVRGAATSLAWLGLAVESLGGRCWDIVEVHLQPQLRRGLRRQTGRRWLIRAGIANPLMRTEFCGYFVDRTDTLGAHIKGRMCPAIRTRGKPNMRNRRAAIRPVVESLEHP